ncbi:MAG TPA: sigma-70 family RNA polymerase sigma factor [Cyclobacteriaceae bacterium]|nr:sigma-70 family RNA polymerase sigma factor [Cyclobacteriaceae bacterium]
MQRQSEMPETLDNERFRLLLGAMPAKAIELLYDHYFEGLVHLSIKFVSDRNIAEDVVQDTLVHVWEQHKELSNHHDLPIHFYLARVVRNKSITFYKQHLKLMDNYAQFLNGNRVPSLEQTVESQLIDHEIAERIKARIATFPYRERQCLEMKIDRLMTTKEIAAELGITVKAVERTITSAHKRLRKWAKKEF